MGALLYGKSISVVIPAHREALGIAATIDAVRRELVEEVEDYEILVVDDGSPDDTFAVVREVAAGNRRVRGIRLSRNFGKEAALLAGLRAATGDAVITMDADLQHPPAMIPNLIRAWRDGAMVVSAIKRDRGAGSGISRWCAEIFNALFTRLSGFNLLNASDFKLLDRHVVDILVESFPEKMRFYRGLTEWIGFEQVSLPFDVESRYAGQSSYTVQSLIHVAGTALLSFTSAPLRIVSVLGVIAMVLGAGIATDALLSWSRGEAVSGFSTLIITLLFLGSSILVSLGIIGEYVAKIYNETKSRPSYLIASSVGLQDGSQQRATKSEPLRQLIK